MDIKDHEVIINLVEDMDEVADEAEVEVEAEVEAEVVVEDVAEDVVEDGENNMVQEEIMVNHNIRILKAVNNKVIHM